jgi:hypothetical protein
MQGNAARIPRKKFLACLWFDTNFKIRCIRHIYPDNVASVWIRIEFALRSTGCHVDDFFLSKPANLNDAQKRYVVPCAEEYRTHPWVLYSSQSP